MKHVFDIEIARKYGIVAAIILENLGYWIRRNEANETNFHDGYFWTYNSKRALTELFPYLTERQIGIAFQKLIDEGLVLTGNYNKNPMDRTLWYALSEKGKCILHYCEMHFTSTSNGFYENAGPIPNINNNIISQVTSNLTHISSNNEKDLSLNPSQVSNDIDTQVAIPGNSLVRDNQVTLTPTPSEKPSVNYADADTVIDYMNSVSGKKYRHIKSNRDRVLARLGEGYSVEDCKTVVKKMWDAWKNTEMEQYFRPETLFRPTKFEGYLNRPAEKGKPRIDPSEYETGKDFGW